MKDQLVVGLTGNRFTGKDKISNHFSNIGIPTFNADVVLKFILQYKVDIDQSVRIQFGKNAYMNSGFLDSSFFDTTEKFNKLIDIVEFDLMEAYNRFQLKNEKAIYTIFHSSILFERKWNEKMDHIISVFTPKNERMGRLRDQLSSKVPLNKMWDLMGIEMDELEKNSLSSFIIHNYSDNNISKQVKEIDQIIVDKYLQAHTF